MAGKESPEKSNERAADELLPLVYEELRRLARHKMSCAPPNQTLQATALVHEAYLRLLDSGKRNWKDRRYFFAAAAEAMRRILIDNARRKQSLRRGGEFERTEFSEIELPSPLASEELMALDEALERFTEQEPEKSELVKLKFFAGLTSAEAARVLGISEATAKRYWAFGRAWLFRAVRKALNSEP